MLPLTGQGREPTQPTANALEEILANEDDNSLLARRHIPLGRSMESTDITRRPR